MRTLIRGGTLVSPEGAEPADVLVEGEIVTAIAAPGSGMADVWQEGADTMVDASGRYVIPGGIDVHTHMEMPFGGTLSSDTFGSWAAFRSYIELLLRTSSIIERSRSRTMISSAESEATSPTVCPRGSTKYDWP